MNLNTDLLRPVRLAVVVAVLPLFAACASSPSHVAAVQPAAEPAVVVVKPDATPSASDLDARGNYRFNMTQSGKRMTADQFDAWMKAHGIRVAKGAAKPAASGSDSIAKTKAAVTASTASKSKAAATKAAASGKQVATAASDG